MTNLASARANPCRPSGMRSGGFFGPLVGARPSHPSENSHGGPHPAADARYDTFGQLGSPVGSRPTLSRTSETSTGVVTFGRPGVPRLFDELLPMQVSLEKSMSMLCQSQARNEKVLKAFMEQHQESQLHSLPATPATLHPEPSLEDFIQQQMKDMKSFLAREVQTCKDEIIAVYREEFAAKSQVTPLSAESHMPAYTDVGAEEPVLKAPSACNSEAEETSRAMCKSESVETPRAINKNSKAMNTSWDDFQKGITDFDGLNKMHNAIKDRSSENSVWHSMEDYVEVKLFLRKAPDNMFARVVEGQSFQSLQNFLIVSNTIFMGIEVDLSIRALLQGEEDKLPAYLKTCNRIFNATFIAELCCRMLVLRSWFFVAPHEWGWNLFDFTVVFSSSFGEILLHGVNFNFMRMLRILRVIRVARVIRILRFFRELRKILFAIMASMASLTWCFIFLALTIYMFSILFLQGLVNGLREMESGSEERLEAIRLTETWYGSMGDCMFHLLAAVTGGVDWLEVREPLVYAGGLYTAAFLLYVLFITLGVMNVLTGVFLSSADDYKDKYAIIQNQQIKRDQFITHMLSIFKEMDTKGTGSIDWPTFFTAMRDDVVQAYLAAHHLEPSHAKILFDLLDEDNTGSINVVDWVMGMVRLKGEAKAIDARVIQRELGMLPSMLHCSLASHHRALEETKLVE